MADTDWRVRAVCRSVDPELFFPDTACEPSDGSPDEALVAAQVAAAKAVCRGCPVRQRCLAEALERIPYGIAGGLTAGERRRARAARGLGAARRPRWRVLLEGGSSVVEVARECGVSVRTVERWVARHEDERAGQTGRAAAGMADPGRAAAGIAGAGRGSR
ncbi:MAG: WhiB family transcriptional regulator [Catenulispora sp.]